ncbi:MAG: hypothetical protein RBT49_09960 [Bacteroidales bacterium]|jgi:REP element-mobilizing transposase RayT|nr:hypothetical protein [Bacteroidales bacterium]
MKVPIEYGKYYHIYNRGNNYEDLFINEEDYLHFLFIYEIYISSIADTFAWCLMKNHFHFLVRIKEEKEIGFLNSENIKSEDASVKWKTYFPDVQDKKFNKKPTPTNQFKHLFNAYTRWFNISHDRISSLFEKNFKRKVITNEKQLKNLIVYIHNNPVNHGFAESILEYPWTSYLELITQEPTILKRGQVLGYFDNVENFKFVHSLYSEKQVEMINDFIVE